MAALGAPGSSRVGSTRAPFWPQAVSASVAVASPATATVHRARVALGKSRDGGVGAGLATLDCCAITLILPTMSSPTAAPGDPAPVLSDAAYRQLSDAALAAIESTVDQWLQDDVVDIDSHRTGGLLELSFPNGSKLIINTQPPLQELWLAARSGGFHYRWVDGRWCDTRDGSEFFAAVSRCASEQAGKTLRFSPPT